MRDVLMDVLEEHLGEASFLWNQRERGLVASNLTLVDVAEIEARLLAHVDGLIVAGVPAVEKLLIPALEEMEAEQVAAAAYTLLNVQEPSGTDLVRTALEATSSEVLPALYRALELRGSEALPSWLPTLLKQEDPTRLALSLELHATHGVDPGPTLPELLRHKEPRVAAAALRVAARIHHPLDRHLFQSYLNSTEPKLRDAAIEAGLLGGHRSAWAACQSAVESRAPDLRFPALLLALGGEARDEEQLRQLLHEPRHRPDTLWALGFSGRRSAAEACLEWMEDPTVSHLALEAFCAITGLPLEERFVVQPSEEDSLPPLEEDDLTADLTHKPEDDLPRPATTAVLAWWKDEQPRFEMERRYLYGKPFGLESLYESLLTAPMRRRHVPALDLALRSRGELTVPTRALTSHQRQALEKLRTASPSLFRTPFTSGLRKS
ncbi:TIGR02270 family protein [Corallococcus sp. CA047B]|uniref:TIGR02270 family protein n=1 Tax=Corallococcus sp. CA047B TaxID=2316729 RepID=UPI000EA38A7E|nr:TIGR02270 family protein [Corallococcus sp. CA047B]RKH20224.1 TIGR02270 family protein [Corallococcus sp. CA047B]